MMLEPQEVPEWLEKGYLGRWITWPPTEDIPEHHSD